MTPRGTDWSLALAVAVLAATGVLTLFAGSPGAAWVFSVHAAAGFSLLLLLWWTFRRVLRRLVDPRRWDRRTGAGAAAALLVVSVLGFGIAWSSGANSALGGFRLSRGTTSSAWSSCWRWPCTPRRAAEGPDRHRVSN